MVTQWAMYIGAEEQQANANMSDPIQVITGILPQKEIDDGLAHAVSSVHCECVCVLGSVGPKWKPLNLHFLLRVGRTL